jgi:hypothetical protein
MGLLLLWATSIAIYGGSASDKAITADCGILSKLEAGDSILADKGFTIRDT